jgi:hypothetical protein
VQIGVQPLAPAAIKDSSAQRLRPATVIIFSLPSSAMIANRAFAQALFSVIAQTPLQNQLQDRAFVAIIPEHPSH